MPYCPDCGKFVDEAHISDTAGCHHDTPYTTIHEGQRHARRTVEARRGDINNPGHEYYNKPFPSGLNRRVGPSDRRNNE